MKRTWFCGACAHSFIGLLFSFAVSPAWAGQSPSYNWARPAGSDVSDSTNAVAQDAAGNVVAAGCFAGSVDFGVGPMSSAGGLDGFLARYDATGNILWAKQFGGTTDDTATGVAISSAGNVIVAGTYTGTINFGDGPKNSAGATDIFLASYTSTGVLLWSKSFGGTSVELPPSLALDASGNICLAGGFHNTINFGGGALNSAGLTDAFLAKFSPTGTFIFAKRFGDSADQWANSVAVDPSGNILLTGQFKGTIVFGGPTLTSAGGNDIFVAKFDSSGNQLWTKGYGDLADQIGSSIAADGSGNVLVTGSIRGTTDFGGGPIAANGADIFVLKLDPAGNHFASKGIGGPGDDTGRGIAADSAGNIVLTGDFAQTVDFGGGLVTSAGGTDGFLLRLDPGGAYLCGRTFGDTADDHGNAVARAASGQTLILGGSFDNTADLGAGPVAGDMFVASYGACANACPGSTNPTDCSCADIDDNGIVDLSDLSLLISAYGHTGANLPGDCTAPCGLVDLSDLSYLISRYGKSGCAIP